MPSTVIAEVATRPNGSSPFFVISSKNDPELTPRVRRVGGHFQEKLKSGMQRTDWRDCQKNGRRQQNRRGQVHRKICRTGFPHLSVIRKCYNDFLRTIECFQSWWMVFWTAFIIGRFDVGIAHLKWPKSVLWCNQRTRKTWQNRRNFFLMDATRG